MCWRGRRSLRGRASSERAGKRYQRGRTERRFFVPDMYAMCGLFRQSKHLSRSSSHPRCHAATAQTANFASNGQHLLRGLHSRLPTLQYSHSMVVASTQLFSDASTRRVWDYYPRFSGHTATPGPHTSQHVVPPDKLVRVYSLTHPRSSMKYGGFEY